LKKKTPAPSPARPFVYRNRTLHCDQVSLAALAEEHGTPLYIYSASQISERFQLFQQAFATRPHTVCYAVKANSSLAILRLLGRQGAGFDIVSGGELERVRRAYPHALKKVVFSGVGKQAWEIDAALKANILQFNVESEQELELLAERAKNLAIRARFALRVNPDVFAETHPYISTGLSEHKFGIAITQARATTFVDMVPKAATDKPELSIAITSNDGKRKETVTIGKFAVDVFAIRAGEPGAGKIEATTLDNIVKALEELK